MELLIMGDTLRRASARSICAVIPYYGYARQDRKTAPRTPITARLIADLITASGFNRVVALDLHAGQIQGFFNFPVDHLFCGSFVMKPYLETKYQGQKITIVSPDAGGTERARTMAKALDAPLRAHPKPTREERLARLGGRNICQGAKLGVCWVIEHEESGAHPGPVKRWGTGAG
jgi:ribose-phosphate pyrophosphokinase